MDARLVKARAWFASRGKVSCEFQEVTWRAYWNGESGLLNATTGTGKTLAAQLGPLLEAAPSRPAPVYSCCGSHRRVHWRAIERALLGLLGFFGSSWWVDQCTSDTSSARRARQKARLPEAAITTPENLPLL